jgi:hypothetical protein
MAPRKRLLAEQTPTSPPITGEKPTSEWDPLQLFSRLAHCEYILTVDPGPFGFTDEVLQNATSQYKMIQAELAARAIQAD